MSQCVKIRRKKRQVCIGDMDTFIQIGTRQLVPDPSGAGAAESFGSELSVWALMESVSGETFFDGVNTEIKVTHKFVVEYNENITATWWILFNDDRYRIIDVEDLDGRQEFMVLRATNRGLDSKEGSHA